MSLSIAHIAAPAFQRIVRLTITKDEILTYLQDAVRGGRINASVYQVVRNYISGTMSNLASSKFHLHGDTNQVYNMNAKRESGSHQEV